MKKLILLFLSVFIVHFGFAQRLPLADSAFVTKHQITANGQKFPDSAKTGTQPVWDASGKVLATVHYAYYPRDDISNKSKRPLVIAFNGGPGSGSV